MLDPTREKFAQEYHATGNASEAASLAGLDLSYEAPLTDAYVYLLLCPLAAQILYVGKGRGRRMFQHVRDAKAGRISGTKKHKALKAYIDQGQMPVAVVFQSGLSDHAALHIEKSLMSAIGRERLSNSTASAGSPHRRALAQLDELESRIMPFDTWIAVRNPKLEHRKYHGEVLAHIAETRTWIEGML